MFYDNFEKYCKLLGKSNSQVTKDIGLDPSSCSGWKKGAVPRNGTLQKLANYFGVTVDDLLDTKKEPAGEDGLGTEWADVEAAYKNATPEARAAAKAAALAVLNSNKK